MALTKVSYSMIDNAPINVADYGAVGDGVVDDTTAIQSALSAGKYVVFGDASKVYKVTATLNLQSGQVLDFNRAKVQMYTAQTRMFNAVGLNNVIIRGGVFQGYRTDFVNSSTSLAVCISVGTNSNRITIQDNYFIWFAYSPVSTVSYGKVTAFSFLDNVVTGPGTSVLSDPTFRNCTGITIDGSIITIQGNVIGDTAQGLIVAADSTDVNIVGNTINTIPIEHGMYIDAGVRNITITGNVLKAIELDGIKFQHNEASSSQEPQNIVCSNNVLLNIGQDGVAINNTTSSPTEYSNAVSITGNTFRVIGQDAINVRYSRNSAINANSIFTTARYGIACVETPSCVIDGNVISNTQSNGIYHNNGGNFVSLTDNVITSPGLSGDPTDGNNSGILFAGGTGVGRFIVGNYVYGDEVDTQYALYYAGGDQTQTRISGNTFVNTYDYAVRVQAQALQYWGENYLKSFTGERSATGLVTATLTRGNPDTYFASAAPTTGTWSRGVIVYDNAPAAGGTLGWVCTASGTPGTWKTFGAITA